MKDVSTRVLATTTSGVLIIMLRSLHQFLAVTPSEEKGSPEDTTTEADLYG
jgi:hypothetical protein